jgi:hypothetical protein
MAAGWRRASKLAGILLIAVACICLAVALRFEFRKHALSGVPWGHFPVSAEGGKFHVPMRAGPMEDRPRTAMTEEQFREWQENHKIVGMLALPGVLCWLAGVTIIAFARKVRSRQEHLASCEKDDKGGRAPAAEKDGGGPV